MLRRPCKQADVWAKAKAHLSQTCSCWVQHPVAGRRSPSMATCAAVTALLLTRSSSVYLTGPAATTPTSAGSCLQGACTAQPALQASTAAPALQAIMGSCQAGVCVSRSGAPGASRHTLSACISRGSPLRFQCSELGGHPADVPGFVRCTLSAAITSTFLSLGRCRCSTPTVYGGSQLPAWQHA